MEEGYDLTVFLMRWSVITHFLLSFSSVALKKVCVRVFASTACSQVTLTVA